MQVKVIEILPKHSVIEYTDSDGYIQRRVIPQGLHSFVKRGPATIPDEVVALGIEYSNVDLTAVLGEQLPAIRVRDLENELRKAGLWTQKDYETKPKHVNGVWQRLRGVDVTTIINAALSRLT